MTRPTKDILSIQRIVFRHKKRSTWNEALTGTVWMNLESIMPTGKNSHKYYDSIILEMTRTGTSIEMCKCCLVLEAGLHEKWLLKEIKLLFGVARCSKIDCGGSCTTLWIYWTIELYTLKELHVNCIICKLYLKGYYRKGKTPVEFLKVVPGPNSPPLPSTHEYSTHFELQK